MTRSVVVSVDVVRLDELEEQIRNLQGCQVRALESIKAELKADSIIDVRKIMMAEMQSIMSGVLKEKGNVDGGDQGENLGGHQEPSNKGILPIPRGSMN